MPTDAIELRDIHVVLGHPWWPLAPGWWLLLGALALLALLAWRFDRLWRLRVPIPVITLGTWRWDAAQALRRLRQNLDSGAPVKDIATELSELLRRIAMARHGRAACAGLHGEAWLGWLATHDPSGFDWRREGRLLLAAPYAPPQRVEAERAALRRLIAAALDWVGARDPRPARAKRAERPSPAWRRRRTGAAATPAAGSAAAPATTSAAEAPPSLAGTAGG